MLLNYPKQNLQQKLFSLLPRIEPRSQFSQQCVVHSANSQNHKFKICFSVFLIWIRETSRVRCCCIIAKEKRLPRSLSYVTALRWLARTDFFEGRPGALFPHMLFFFSRCRIERSIFPRDVTKITQTKTHTIFMEFRESCRFSFFLC